MVLLCPVIPNFPKLKAAQRSVVPLPTRSFSQVVSCTFAHLHCVARQGVSLACITYLLKLTTFYRPMFVCAQFTGAYCPVCEIWGTCNRIHSVLILAMRSGAFLHLVVTLTALVARLAHLSSALRHVLSALHAESIRLLDTLHVRNRLRHS